MKNLVVLGVALLSVSSANAKINVASIISQGDSAEVEATQLVHVLKSIGAKGYLDQNKHVSYKLNGEVLMTNGAACDNGHRTYGVQLVELNDKDEAIGKIDLDGSQACTKVSTAEKFSRLLDRWGASTLLGSCGMGHCWEKITSITCTRYEASAQSKAFDVCAIEMTNDR